MRNFKREKKLNFKNFPDSTSCGLRSVAVPAPFPQILDPPLNRSGRSGVCDIRYNARSLAGRPGLMLYSVHTMQASLRFHTHINITGYEQ